MKRLCALVCVVAVLCLIVALSPAPAQTTAATNSSADLFRYDITKEVTLTGTVSSVSGQPTSASASGHAIGGRVLINSSSQGLIDANLGHLAFVGKDALSLAAGDQVSAVGEMKTVGDKQVFLVRTITVRGQVHAIRDERGGLVTPLARERAKQNGNESTQTKEAL